MSMDLYQEITNRIIKELENGVVPWHKPWRCASGAISRATGKPYSVLNQMMRAVLSRGKITFMQSVTRK